MIAAAWTILTSRRAGPILGGLGLGLALAAGALSVQLHAADKRADALFAAIHDEQSGYIVRLDRCARNGAALEASLGAQNARLDALGKDSAARLAAAEAALARARTVTDQANARIAVLMSRPPQGIDTCARVLDVDGRVKEMLKP